MCITCVADTCVLHMYYMCNTCVGYAPVETCIPTHVIHVYDIHVYYTFETCVLQVFTHVLQVYNLHI